LAPPNGHAYCWKQCSQLFSSAKKYDLGLGKNLPKSHDAENDETRPPLNATSATLNWMAPTGVEKPPEAIPKHSSENKVPYKVHVQRRRTRKLVSRTEETRQLRGAVWDEEHYQASREHDRVKNENLLLLSGSNPTIEPPSLLYPDIDLSIPSSVYSEDTDAIWELLRYEAYREAQREPLLVSFLYSTILNHNSLESALAFHLANRLSSPAMISTQLQALMLEALENSPEFRKSLRADVMAVRDRDPACTCLPDAFLYFKGFAALQAYRVAHYLYRSGRQVLAHFLQSQVSQSFQIDIHPNATLGSGIMLDHGTGIVIGETATVGHNCSILHHVTLGGSGRRGNDRHPKIGDGVLLGAGASVLGNVRVGDGCQVGAGTLVIANLPPHSVAVGVPAKVIGSFLDVTEQPSIGMNQMTGTRDFDEHIVTFESGGI
jgi:serine O-acetyltransferase